MYSAIGAKLFLVAVFLLCISSQSSSFRTDRGRLDALLMADLTSFAEKNGLSGEQLQQMLGSLAINQKAIAKGGVGSLGDDAFVVLNDKSSSLPPDSGGRRQRCLCQGWKICKSCVPKGRI